MWGQQPYTVLEVELTVYRDGLVHVRQLLLVNESFPTISVPLLSSAIANVLVTDQIGSPLSYELTPPNMRVNTLGANKAAIEYDTLALTRKEGLVWTLTLDLPYRATVNLPERSTILHLNDLPENIKADGYRLNLIVGPGHWEISYTISLATTAETTVSVPFVTPRIADYVLWAVLIILLSTGVAAILFARRRRWRALLGEGGLTPDDEEVLRLIASRGGRIFEVDLRGVLAQPKTTVWRRVKKLEALGLLKIRRVGIQNEIVLVR